MSNITVRKLKLVIVQEDEKLRKEQYKFIRDSQYSQYRGLNRAMGYLMTAYYNNDMNISSEDFKQCQKNITNSAPFFKDIEFGKGIDSKSAITQKVKKDFSIALKNGLAKGERSGNNYKRDFPLMTRGRHLNFYYNEDNEILIKWVNGITFKVITTKKVRNIRISDVELEHTLHKVINKEYKLGQSSLYFDRNNKLILNLTIDMINITTKEIVKGRSLGVDLGVKIPAYATVSDKTYIRHKFGSFEEFAKVRKQFKKRRERLQSQLVLVKGGKGRKDKIRAMNQLRDKESNFAKTYNHQISKRIVDFAVANQCEYINLEDLTSISQDKKDKQLLGVWSYYQLQTYIEEKAKRVGIKVRYVSASYTSQKCSICGNIDKKNRITQEKFKCTRCGVELNADYNASINIAKSTK